jgi:prepilin-type N-terminal cleavage/methylation domain-containing protein
MKKKQKNGFTIIELVVVMSILLLVTATSIVSYHRITTNYKEKEYERIVSDFEAAAEVYASMNNDIKDRVYSGNGFATVTLKVLKDEGLVDDDATDPITGAAFEDQNYVSIYLDENRNMFAVYMREVGSAFTNSKSKTSILAGTMYSQTQMIEYIVGYVRGEYDEQTGSYGTKEIDYSLIDIKISDITGGTPVELTNNQYVPTDSTAIGHTYKITYSYDFGDVDGVKTLTRDVTVYNTAPILTSVTLDPGNYFVYTKNNVTATATGESVHGNVTYHFVVNGNDYEQTTNTYVLEENNTIGVYVEDAYGWKSDTTTKTVGYIDKVAPTFNTEVTENLRFGAFIEVVDATDDASGIPSQAVKFNNSTVWTYIGRDYVDRNGTYTYTLRDNAGNETVKSTEITNIKMMDFVGKSKEEVADYCSNWERMSCKFVGTTNKYASVSSQTIATDTPIADGMVQTLTMTAPAYSITVLVTNGYVEGGVTTLTVEKGESGSFVIKPSNGYEMSGAEAVCGSGATPTLSGENLTVSNVLGNVDCTVTTHKIPVVYYSGGSSSGGSSYCASCSILAQMQANSAAWHSADPATQASLHTANVGLASQLSSITSTPTTFTSGNGTWNTPSGRLY